MAVFSSLPFSSSATTRQATPPSPGGKNKRSRGGCTTCRVRRKKCDVTEHPTGDCETCTRLRIPCLGFDPRRPAWLAVKPNELALREIIKAHLLSQGLMKGQAGSQNLVVHGPPQTLTLHWIFENLPDRSMLPPPYYHPRVSQQFVFQQPPQYVFQPAAAPLASFPHPGPGMGDLRLDATGSAGPSAPALLGAIDPYLLMPSNMHFMDGTNAIDIAGMGTTSPVGMDLYNGYVTNYDPYLSSPSSTDSALTPESDFFDIFNQHQNL